MRAKYFLFILILVVTILSGTGWFSAKAEIVNFSEDFTSWTHRDAAFTEAHWDTLTGTLRLFPVGLDSLGFLSTVGAARASAISGTTLLVATSNLNTLSSFDVSDPTAGNALDQFTLLDDATDLIVSGSTAMVAVGSPGIQTINIGDPGELLAGGSLDLLGYASGMIKNGDRLYVAQSDAGVAVVNVSNPWNPVLVTNASTGDWARDVDIRGNQLFVADGYAGMTVLNVVNPDSPQLITSFSVSGNCYSLDVHEDRAYLANLTSGMFIVDITDPANPATLGHIDFPGGGSCRNVFAQGDTVYAAVSDEGLFVVDVSDPTDPVILGNRDTPGTAYHVQSDAGVVWVADGNGGMRIFELNPNALDLGNNLAQSLNLIQAGEPVTRAKLSAVTTDSVRFELTVDGGMNWHPVQPDEDFMEFDVPGEDFRWRAYLVQTSEDLVPTCSQIDLTFEQLHGYGGISSIEDVADDAGGQVRLSWSRSRYDATESDYEVTEYSIYRRFDPTHQKKGTPDLAYPEGSWDFVGSVPADMETEYATVVPTLGDSTATGGVTWSVFFVRARTTITGTFFDSPPDSGYSVNNLQPAPPTGFWIDRSPAEGSQLSWDPPSIADFAHFRIYRSTNLSVPPQPGTLWQVTTGTEVFDSDPGQWYYRLTQVNLAGQESESATGYSAAPDANQGLVLHPNSPNPFNPRTVIRFEVPSSGAELNVAVFDARGRRLRTLAQEFFPGGSHRLIWDGRDQQGQSVSSGVYHAMISDKTSYQVVKMMLLR